MPIQIDRPPRAVVRFACGAAPGPTGPKAVDLVDDAIASDEEMADGGQVVATGAEDAGTMRVALFAGRRGGGAGLRRHGKNTGTAIDIAFCCKDCNFNDWRHTSFWCLWKDSDAFCSGPRAAVETCSEAEMACEAARRQLQRGQIDWAKTLSTTRSKKLVCICCAQKYHNEEHVSSEGKLANRFRELSARSKHLQISKNRAQRVIKHTDEKL